MEINTTIVKLKEYFTKQPSVAMAFVFGSQITGRAMTESDIDIAVYFKPEGRALEWEEAKFYKDEDKIWSEVENIVGIKTDFIVLNRAPSNIAFSAMNDGKPIIIKDRGLFWRLFLSVSSAAEYFREFVEDFWVIKQRSASLNDIDRERLIRIIDFFEMEIKDYNKFIGLDQKNYEQDDSIRRNVERWAENIVNSSVDMSKILLASESKKIPQTYREILQGLSLLNNFDTEMAEKLSQFAKLRNILAHEYLDLRFVQIKKFVQESEPAYKYLLDFVKKILIKPQSL